MGIDPNKLYKATEVAEVFNCSSRTVRQLISDRRIESVRVSRTVRIPGTELQRYLSSNTTKRRDS